MGERRGVTRLTIVYTSVAPESVTTDLVPAEGRADASIIARRTSDATLFAPSPPWPQSMDGVPLTDPVQQWRDVLELGGDDRREAADRLRSAIHDVSSALSEVGAAEDYRLIGGVSVMLHVQRLELDLPRRATGDADFGVPPHVLRRPDLVEAIEAIGYRKVLGNRWERRLDDRRMAAVDL